MPLAAKLAKPDDKTKATAALLESLEGQSHLYSSWPKAGVDDDKKTQLLEQIAHLDSNYPGGLKAYIASARKLLGESQRGENPLAGWSPSVPADGYDLAPGTPEYEEYERRGLDECAQGRLGFVVPAGGLGERLGGRRSYVSAQIAVRPALRAALTSVARATQASTASSLRCPSRRAPASACSACTAPTSARSSSSRPRR